MCGWRGATGAGTGWGATAAPVKSGTPWVAVYGIGDATAVPAHRTNEKTTPSKPARMPESSQPLAETRADADHPGWVMPPSTAQRAVIDWEEALTRVIGEPELVRPVFQPLVDLERGVVCGYEMLARFESPIKAPPPAWFEAAERLGLGGRLESILIRAGLAAKQSLGPNRFLTINVSPRALVTDEVRAALLTGPALGGVVVEITEQAAVEDYDSVRAVLDAVRSRGGSIAVDDAGAGYASLSHIVALRPQFVKLDRGLITDLDRDEAKLAVVEAFGSFANKIDAWIVAEGIERTGELDALLRLGVPLGQGFGLGRPQSAMGDIDTSVASHIRDRATARSERDSVVALDRPRADRSTPRRTGSRSTRCTPPTPRSPTSSASTSAPGPSPSCRASRPARARSPACP